jgi:hypothetical protein
VIGSPGAAASALYLGGLVPASAIWALSLSPFVPLNPPMKKARGRDFGLGASSLAGAALDTFRRRY